ncbi:MAG TPA: T9SS type A sorting domain-containing protein [Bacteroidales bacterium]|nr:T9SS type A sorting domain-containing protein [Bacteroidales bacterium]HRX96603.1 T9SS type A sorting domain-containing protein [Bacteroidales bacterium]
MNLVPLLRFIKIFLLIIFTKLSIGQDTFKLTNGGKVQIMTGTTFQSTDLNIGAGSQLTNKGYLTVNGILANNAGTSGLILKADENGFGSLLHNTNLAPATIQQYLSSERWHLITPPVQQTIIGLFENLYLKQWHENTANWEYLITPLTTQMNMTQGYAVWAADELTGPKTIVFEGSTRAGNTAFADLTYTTGTGQDGWNLVGNPYPSPVEWNTDWSLNNVGGWAIVYENGTFKGWNPWMPEGEQSFNGKTDGFIAPAQGFWIRATGSNPNVFIPQSARAHNSVNFLKDELVSDALSLHISVSANEFTDETVILFLEGAETAFDPLYDLEKHMNVAESPNIYSIPQAGKKYAINVLPGDWIENTSNAVIPLGFLIEPASNCLMMVEGVDKFDINQSIYLEDLKLGTLQNLNSNNVYSFEASADDDPNRFLIHFGQPSLTPVNYEPVWKIYSYRHEVFINKENENQVMVQIFDITGRLIHSSKIIDRLTKIYIDQGGQYLVKVIDCNNTITRKVIISNQ